MQLGMFSVVVLLLLSIKVQGQCVLTVPANPLSAQGLATPYTMRGCDQAGDNPSFVEAVIFDPATKQLSIYPPLVINAGTQPAVAPVVPKLPTNAVVGIWFGTNGDTLQLTGAGVAAGKCVNGVGKSIFGQFAYCNAPAFFAAAANAVNVPALGKGADGMACLTTRDFGLVDMDQSDNVDTTYLVTKNKQLAQNTAANRKRLAGAQVISNGSDNALLMTVLQTLKCNRFQAPDLSDPGSTLSALALNEIIAAKLQQAPIAIVPENDPMTLVNGKANAIKRDLYRIGVNQQRGAAGTSTTYCQNFRKVAPVRYAAGMGLTSKATSPDPEVGTNLFTFLCGRFEASYGADGLNCVGLLKQASPFQVTMNKQGVVTACAVKKAAK